MRATVRFMTEPVRGEVFDDEEVARLYRYRPPYPEAVFRRLNRLCVDPRTVLDAGAGTGALARGMARFAVQIDAVEPSAAMIAVGRRLSGGSDPRIQWLRARAEDAPLSPSYGLITCGTSLHWMDLDLVLPRFRDALAPGARLAIVHTENVHGPYFDDVLAVRQQFERGDHPDEYDLVSRLQDAGRLVVEDEERTEPVPFEQSVQEYLGYLHSTSTLARRGLGPRADEFDETIRSVLRRHRIERLRYGVVGHIAWGRPS